MADKDDTSNVPPDRNSDPTHVSAETSPAAGDRKVSNRSALIRIERAIEAQREQLLQAYGVLTCLYEVLLYAEGDDAINYAQAAHAAARLINKSVEDLDSVRIRPMIDELVFKRGDQRMVKRKSTPVVAVESIASSIHVVRGQPVLLDVDLAALYGVETRVLLQAVKRNLERFPGDFLLQLTAGEWKSLRSQIVTSNLQHGGRRYTPYAFTEQGVAMLSSVLKSSRAVAVNIEIMRTFVRMRGGPPSNNELAQELTEVKRRVESHDTVLVEVMDSISALKNARETPED